tara:strand:+ start:2319 stop:2660 length:342 start_codon:yes stop_codon:yes gene_type:complete
MSFFSTAYAAAAPAAGQHPQGSIWSTVIMLAVFFAIFYFLLIRPQQKRAKAQRELLAALGQGDEVVTNSGIVGQVKTIEDTFVHLEIAENVIIKIQKQAVTTVLPKGSLVEKA